MSNCPAGHPRHRAICILVSLHAWIGMARSWPQVHGAHPARQPRPIVPDYDMTEYLIRSFLIPGRSARSVARTWPPRPTSAHTQTHSCFFVSDLMHVFQTGQCDPMHAMLVHAVMFRTLTPTSCGCSGVLYQACHAVGGGGGGNACQCRQALPGTVGAVGFSRGAGVAVDETLSKQHTDTVY